jgi:hypothetical protein
MCVKGMQKTKFCIVDVAVFLMRKRMQFFQ